MSNYRHDRLFNHEDEGFSYDPANITRGWCIVGLVLSWVAGNTAIVLGILALRQESQDGKTPTVGHVPTGLREMLPLGMNIVVTILNESMGYIHSSALRWSMLKERDNNNNSKLTFNSNLRLFSSSRESPANSRYSNALFLVCIVLTYASTSMIFVGPRASQKYEIF